VEADIAMTTGDEIVSWARTVMPAHAAIESAASLNAVAGWRNAWRPPRVRVLLVAESHVAPLEGDHGVGVFLGQHSDVNAPADYVRLVYCLGYGEDAVCSRPPINNGGTWQYWDLFGQIARGHDQLQPRRGAATSAERLRWKIETLCMLRDRGIWLADASVVALYSGGKKLATGNAYRRVVRESWCRFVWPDVAADAPEQVWIVGHGVAQAIGGEPGTSAARVIDQPQSRDHERFKRGVRELVDASAALPPTP
jgi:hypothetical protein